ncbi:MAG: hypothetical protein QM639_18670 [Rhodocyclaceae bacterium]
MALVLWVGATGAAPAATVNYNSAFSFAHTGTVSTGLLSIGGTFTNTTTTSAPAATLPQFNRTLGRLTQVSVSITTTSSPYTVAPTGLLSLISSGTATQGLAYSVSAGASSVSDAAQVTVTGSTLLTLLNLGGGNIGGAPLNSSRQFTAAADLARYTGSGTLAVGVTATDTFTITALVSALNGGGMNGSGTYTGTVTVSYDYTPWSVAGYVYNDVNHDGARDSSETGTGLTLYAKLLSSATGPVLQTVAVDASTGRYAFDVSTGSYRVIIDDNATTSDITPLVPAAGWTATQAPTLYRDVVVGTELPSQDFGLIQATLLSGRVFLDNGVGGGTANDGLINGTEAGMPSRQVRLSTAAGTQLDQAASDGNGNFRLFIPASVALSTALRVRLLPDASFVSTGGTVGSTGGTYTRATSEVAFTLASRAALTAVNFGSVHVPMLTGGSEQQGAPGSVLTFSHLFLAPTSGQISFAVSAASLPWPTSLYRDVNANGVIDTGDTPLSAPVAVTAGQAVAVLVRVFIPDNAAPNIRMTSTLTAQFTYTNATPALSQSLTATNLADVGLRSGGALVLVKSVNRSSALPGDTVIFVINFTNAGQAPISNIVIADTTPAFTRFAAASTDTTPSGMTAPTISAPAPGAIGDIRWTFGGQLAPGASGAVRFSVVIE